MWSFCGPDRSIQPQHSLSQSLMQRKALTSNSHLTAKHKLKQQLLVQNLQQVIQKI